MNRTVFEEYLPEAVDEVRRLRARFAHTAPRSWSPAMAAVELSVQVGHLALCLLRRGRVDVTALDDPQRPLTDIGDELADVVLAALSIAVLADREPAQIPQPPQVSNEVEAFLRLLVAAGSLSESTLVEHHYRHRPTGTPPSLPEATAAIVAACEGTANLLGLDLLDEFRSMVADADSFLDRRGVPS